MIVGGRTIKTNQLIIQVQKTKPKGYGIPGEIDLFYDIEHHTYRDKLGNPAIHPDTHFIAVQDTLISESTDETPF